MLDELSGSQFRDWALAYELDPWGDEREDLRMARIVWATLQPHTRRRLREASFMLRFMGATTVNGVAQYRQKAMQRYGMIVAAMERKALPAPVETPDG